MGRVRRWAWRAGGGDFSVIAPGLLIGVNKCLTILVRRYPQARNRLEVRRSRARPGCAIAAVSILWLVAGEVLNI